MRFITMLLLAGCTSPAGNGHLDMAMPVATDLSQPKHKHVVFTAATFIGSLGGVDGADAKCQSAIDAASAAGLADFTGSSWKAWISSSAVDAIDRIADVGPWYLPDNSKIVFNNKAHLALNPPSTLADITSDERSHDYGYQMPVWAGTAIGGRNMGLDTCSDWTDGSCAGSGFIGGDVATYLGNPGTLPWTWTETESTACCVNTALLCFEQ